MTAMSPREMVGTKLLFENDRVRVWEMCLAPGERSTNHEHALDYVIVQVDGDRIAVDPDPKTVGDYKDYLEVDVKRGFALYLEKGGIEAAVNPGKKTYYEIMVEFKK